MSAEKLRLERLRQCLAERGLKMTQERRAVYEAVCRFQGHFDAGVLYEGMHKRGVPIARDTIFRTIPLLLACGLIQKSVGDEQREYYEKVGVRGHHDHMVCIHCGKVIEFSSGKLERLQLQLAKQHQFKLVFHDHRLFGYCAHCAKMPLATKFNSD